MTGNAEGLPLGGQLTDVLDELAYLKADAAAMQSRLGDAMKALSEVLAALQAAEADTTRQCVADALASLSGNPAATAHIIELPPVAMHDDETSTLPPAVEAATAASRWAATGQASNAPADPGDPATAEGLADATASIKETPAPGAEILVLKRRRAAAPARSPGGLRAAPWVALTAGFAVATVWLGLDGRPDMAPIAAVDFAATCDGLFGLVRSECLRIAALAR